MFCEGEVYGYFIVCRVFVRWRMAKELRVRMWLKGSGFFELFLFVGVRRRIEISGFVLYILERFRDLVRGWVFCELFCFF